MEIYVIGVDYDKGVYQDRAYDNVLLTTIESGRKHKSTTTHVVGFDVAKNPVIKVKNNFAERVMSNGFDIKSFEDLNHCKVDFSFDRYGNVDCVKVLKQNAIEIILV